MGVVLSTHNTRLMCACKGSLRQRRRVRARAPKKALAKIATEEEIAAKKGGIAYARHVSEAERPGPSSGR